MLRSMDAAVAGLRAHQNKLDVISNNIANVNTFGFKSQTYSFKEAMYQTTTPSTGGKDSSGGVNAAQYGYGSMTGSIITDMSASTPTYVGGLNATINGTGFFITHSLNKEVSNAADSKDVLKAGFAYTRVGQFKLDSNGYLTDANGNFIYGFQPAKIGDDPDTTKLVPLRAPDDKDAFTDKAILLNNVSINEAGELTAMNEDGESISLGVIAIASFQNPEGLTKKGEFYYGNTENDNAGKVSATAPGNGSTPTLMTGYLEASNVDLSQQFADMITTQRGFQANAKIITVSDEILQEMVNMKR